MKFNSEAQRKNDQHNAAFETFWRFIVEGGHDPDEIYQCAQADAIAATSSGSKLPSLKTWLAQKPWERRRN